MENMNEFAKSATLDHMPKDGRERGSPSPIAVSPAIAIRAGRAAASEMLCTPLNMTAIPVRAPRTPYWMSCERFAPAIAATMTDNRAVHTVLNTTARTTIPRVQA